jgi:hypothetical protein
VWDGRFFGGHLGSLYIFLKPSSCGAQLAGRSTLGRLPWIVIFIICFNRRHIRFLCRKKRVDNSFKCYFQIILHNLKRGLLCDLSKKNNVKWLPGIVINFDQRVWQNTWFRENYLLKRADNSSKMHLLWVSSGKLWKYLIKIIDSAKKLQFGENSKLKKGHNSWKLKIWVISLVDIVSPCNN